MSLTYPYGVGLGNVGSYQVSGQPFVSGSIPLTTAPVEISFPQVTQRFIVAKMAGSNIRVGFSANGVNGNNYFLMSGNLPTAEFNVKVSSVFLRADAGTATASLSAEMTNIDAHQLWNSGPSGSNWSGSLGVG